MCIVVVSIINTTSIIIKIMTSVRCFFRHRVSFAARRN